ncbi:MAG: hypothetical protein EHM14_05925 [Methanothrix sp.]|nr:MAG: hypothetical protein EHM14_05925 [Methanothrix sp.]
MCCPSSPKDGEREPRRSCGRGRALARARTRTRGPMRAPAHAAPREGARVRGLREGWSTARSGREYSHRAKRDLTRSREGREVGQ